jgi:hypothetical protein
MRPPKSPSLGQSASFDASCMQISSMVWSVGPVTKKKEKYIYAYISSMWGAAPSQPIVTIFGRCSGLADVINCAKFQNHWSRCFSGGLKMACSHRKGKSFLTLCLALTRLHVIGVALFYLAAVLAI